MSSLETALLRYIRNNHIAFVRNVPVSSIVFDERAIYKCKYGCRNFDRKHSCPPESLRTREEIRRGEYQWVLLFATTSKIPRRFTPYRRRLENYVRENEIQRISQDIDAIFNEHGVFHGTLSGGSCHRCRICSRMKGNACVRPSRMQTSMEAIGIDCQKTMHRAGFDFQMPNIDSINRCGSVFHGVDTLRGFGAWTRESNQKYVRPTLAHTIKLCKEFAHLHPELFESIRVVPVTGLPIAKNECSNCAFRGENLSCPPYSDQIRISLWNHAIIWKWTENECKEYDYSHAFLEFHKRVFSLGHYLSLSLRDGPCDGCIRCAPKVGNSAECPHRRLMAPSIQSQGIDISLLGSGRYGIELI